MSRGALPASGLAARCVGGKGPIRAEKTLTALARNRVIRLLHHSREDFARLVCGAYALRIVSDIGVRLQ